MNLRSLLLLLDDSLACAGRTQLAIQLARERDCHLVGLAPTGRIDMPSATGVDAGLDDYAARAWDHLREQATRAAQRFRDDCHVADIKSFETVIDEDDKAASLVAHAHSSDLVVLSQARPDATDHRLVQAVVEEVVLHSARPTLVIPHTGRFERVGTNVLVAWDDSREAARAISDALPILCHADRVHLVHWKRSDAPDSEALRARLDAVCHWLMWHGVSAEAHHESSDLGIGRAILSRAAAIQADLLVMGAYGHARWAEHLLGGATRDVLASMTLPVLMSH